MKYLQNQKNKDFARALGLEKSQETRIKNAIQKAYDEAHGSSAQDFNVDEINAAVAPYIRTPEEAFFAGQIIISDIIGTAYEMGIKPVLPNSNKS